MPREQWINRRAVHRITSFRVQREPSAQKRRHRNGQRNRYFPPTRYPPRKRCPHGRKGDHHGRVQCSWKARSLAEHDHRKRPAPSADAAISTTWGRWRAISADCRRSSPSFTADYSTICSTTCGQRWKAAAVAGHASDARPDTMFQWRPDASGGCCSGSYMCTRKAPGTSAAIFALRVCSSSRICSAVRTAFGIGLPPSVPRLDRD